MKSGMIIRVDGSTKRVKPEDGEKFSLDELQEIVGGFVEFVPTKDKSKLMVIDDEGKIKGYKVNTLASQLYSGLSDIVGDVLVCNKDLLE